MLSRGFFCSEVRLLEDDEMDGDGKDAEKYRLGCCNTRGGEAIAMMLGISGGGWGERQRCRDDSLAQVNPCSCTSSRVQVHTQMHVFIGSIFPYHALTRTHPCCCLRFVCFRDGVVTEGGVKE